MMDANMEQNSVTLSLSDAVKIDDAAKKMGCTVESLLREAGNEERLLYVALKPYSATLRAPRSHPNPRSMTHTNRTGCIVAMMSHYAELLVIHGSAEIAGYQASFIKGDILDWHKWVLDAPQTINVDMVFVPRSQLPVMPADALAAIEQAATDGERIPVAKQQDKAILEWLTLNEYDPLKLPVPPSGKAGVKKLCRDAVTEKNKQLFLSKKVFDTAWQSLRNNEDIKDEE